MRCMKLFEKAMKFCGQALMAKIDVGQPAISTPSITITLVAGKSMQFIIESNLHVLENLYF